MQTKLKFFSTLIVVLFIIAGCQKDTSTEEATPELLSHSIDQSQVSDEIDATANDITAAVESNGLMSGRVSQVLAICGATVVTDSTSNPRKIIITYDGLNCFGTHNRKGLVTLTMPAGVKWKDAGAALTITITDLKITRLRDSKSITINGTKTITNVTGGLLYDLARLNSIKHSISSNNMNISFDNNTSRKWQVAKQRVFTYQNGIVITTTGTHTEGSTSHIAEWGTNRFGHQFTSSTTQPLVIRQDCSFRLTSGQIKHEGAGVAIVTFGLDASGNSTSCPGNGNYYFKLDWTGPGGTTHTVIKPY